jgi:Trypsin-like peptidase domain
MFVKPSSVAMVVKHSTIWISGKNYHLDSMANSAIFSTTKPISHPNSDVAIIKIAASDKPPEKQRDLHPFGEVTINRLSPEGIYGPLVKTGTSKYDDVVVGNEVYVFGFPTSIGLKNVPQIDQLRPLLRKGIVAGRNETLKTIIIDCPVFPGNSGGPVMEMDGSLFDRKFRVVGVAIQFVPFDNSSWMIGATGGTPQFSILAFP